VTTTALKLERDLTSQILSLSLDGAVLPIEVSIETITPDLARVYLAASGGNRPITPKKLADYRRDMEAGRWSFNGEPIIFGWDGKLKDGHHRLESCIGGDVSFIALVVRGIPPEVMATINTGRSRTLADALGIFSYSESQILAAAIGHAMRYDLMLEHDGRHLPGKSGSRAEEMEYLNDPTRHALFENAMSCVVPVKALLPCVPNHMVFLHFIASSHSEAPQTKIDEFVLRVADPAGLDPDEGPAVLRKWFLSQQAASAFKKAHSTVQLAYGVRAMNYWLRDERTKLLRWKPGRKTAGKEGFPRIIPLTAARVLRSRTKGSAA
jgi:hypothetical protein